MAYERAKLYLGRAVVVGSIFAAGALTGVVATYGTAREVHIEGTLSLEADDYNADGKPDLKLDFMGQEAMILSDGEGWRIERKTPAPRKDEPRNVPARNQKDIANLI